MLQSLSLAIRPSGPQVEDAKKGPWGTFRPILSINREVQVLDALSRSDINVDAVEGAASGISATAEGVKGPVCVMYAWTHHSAILNFLSSSNLYHHDSQVFH